MLRHTHLIRVQLDEMLKSKGVGIDKVVNLEIDDELLLKRITGRYDVRPLPPQSQSHDMYWRVPRHCEDRRPSRSATGVTRPSELSPRHSSHEHRTVSESLTPLTLHIKRPLLMSWESLWHPFTHPLLRHGVPGMCRLIHPASGRSYNIHFNPPKVPNKDDVSCCWPPTSGISSRSQAHFTRFAWHLRRSPCRTYMWWFRNSWG